MTEADLLILMIYILVVLYVFNRMVESIDDQIKITLDQDSLTEQLADQRIAEKIGISFKLAPRYDFTHPKELAISVQNKTQNETVHVNWDDCTLVGYDGRSRRVIRLTPNLIRDMAVSQADSVIAPTKSLQEKITAEDVLQRDVDQTYKPVNTIIDISKLKKIPKLFATFEDRNLALRFSLRLVLQISQLTGGVSRQEHLYSIDCRFAVTKLPWTYALPWNQKK